MDSTEAPPESTLPYPPIHTDKRFVVLSDWLVYAFPLDHQVQLSGSLKRYFHDRDSPPLMTFDTYRPPLYYMNTGMGLLPIMIPTTVRIINEPFQC